MTCRTLKASAAALAVVLTVTVVGTASAQGPGGPRRGGPGRLGQMRPATAISVPLPQLDKALTLSADQKTKFQSIRDEFSKAAGALMPGRPEQGSAPPDATAMKAQKDKLDQLDKTYSAKVEALLTADQKTALGALLQDLNDSQAVRFPPNASDQLKLTTDQRTKIHTIAANAEKATKDLVGTDAQSAGPGANRQAIDKIRRDAHDAAVALLTDDQKASLAKLATQGPGGPDAGQAGPPPGGPDGGQAGPPPGGPDGGQAGPPPGGPDGGQAGPPPGGPDA